MQEKRNSIANALELYFPVLSHQFMNYLASLSPGQASRFFRPLLFNASSGSIVCHKQLPLLPRTNQQSKMWVIAPPAIVIPKADHCKIDMLMIIKINWLQHRCRNADFCCEEEIKHRFNQRQRNLDYKYKSILWLSYLYKEFSIHGGTFLIEIDPVVWLKVPGKTVPTLKSTAVVITHNMGCRHISTM